MIISWPCRFNLNENKQNKILWRTRVRERERDEKSETGELCFSSAGRDPWEREKKQDLFTRDIGCPIIKGSDLTAEVWRWSILEMLICAWNEGIFTRQTNSIAFSHSLEIFNRKNVRNPLMRTFIIEIILRFVDRAENVNRRNHASQTSRWFNDLKRRSKID